MSESTSDFKWPVGVSRSIRASAGEVWAAISMPGNLELCHPFCDTNPVTVWPGAESRDEVHYLNGRVYERRFERWIEGVGYDLRIGSPGEATSLVAWRIAPVDRRESRLDITVSPHLLQRVPNAVRWVPHVLYVRPMLTRYLESVVGGFEWYLTRGEAVPRNQFGTHPWFSRR